jgi:hypothetical protein
VVAVSFTGRQWTGDALPGPRAMPVRISVGCARAVVALPKRLYVRSKRLMKAYRSIPCQSCGADDGTVCGAHSNWAIHGKGKSVKADDNRAASLCSRCHTELDQGTAMTEPQRQRMWWLAHVDTVNLLLFNGAWPDDVPLPDVSAFPEQWA